MDLVTLGLAKKYTRQKILEASLGGGEEVDLSGYAKKTELPTKVSQLTNDSGFISKVPDDYATKVWVKDYVTENSGQNAEIDTTLTQSGKAADAKAVGDALDKLEKKIPSIEGLAKTEDIPDVPSWAMQASKPTYTASEVGALPNTYTPPNQTAEQVGADAKGTAAAAVSAHNTNNAAHSDIRLLIEGLANRLNALANSTDTDLDQLAEIVAYIKSNKSLIDGITTSKVSVSDIVNDLTTNVANRPLSAAQGVVLKQLIDGLASGKLDASKLQEAIDTALDEAKKSGDFDGDPGRGIKNIVRTAGDGTAGTVDTYTITYTDGTTSTYQVRNGANGTNGANGAAGKAATFEITGAAALAYGSSPTVTEQSGSTAQARKYVVGIPAGKSGADGRTPVRGKDYWTPDDIAAMDAKLAEMLAKRGQLKPEFANSIEECADTSKLYVLPDGYIYAYMLIEREVETGGGYTNLADPNSSEWFENSRINSSGIVVDAEGLTTTNFISVATGDVIRIRGLDVDTNSSSRAAFYNANKTINSSGKPAANGHDLVDVSIDGGSAQFTINTNAPLLRLCGTLEGDASEVVITVNEEITEGGTEIITEYAWANTGHAFVPADYEERIIELEEDVLQLKNTVGSQDGSTSEAVTLPAYWEPEVEAKTAIVKALQEAGGKHCVSFVNAADLHIDDNDNGRTTDIGKVIATMLDRCHIPWAVLSGDINTRASYGTEEGLLEAQSAMPVHLSPLWGTNRLLLGLGNHDGCWGDSSGYYRHQFPPERMWDIFFRWQALDSRRVFSDDGLYFYVDNVAQKTRFIVLNSNFGGEYAEDDNGWAVNNRFATSCYGQAQLDWLADVALDMPDGYGAVLCAHVPPNITYTVDRAQLIGIVDAYNGRTQFSGDYTTGVAGWSNSSINVDFSGAKGEIIAMFTGHVHGDSIDSTTMSCPIITILSAGASANEPYKDTAPTRTPGTATETSLDVVTINRKTRMIYCTRVGAGDNREVGY